jgi:zinc protease
MKTGHMTILLTTFLLTAGCTSMSSRTAPSTPAAEPAAATAPTIQTVTLPSPESPLVAVRLLFRTGSVDDPAGKEGLAMLTAEMLGNAGTTERSYSDLLNALYPMAASIDVRTDRETTVISGMVHKDTLDEYTDLLLEAVLKPGFQKSDFDRNKAQLESYLKNTLRAGNDELLGLEALQDEIFAGHPYGHAPQGTVEGLDTITLDDVKTFYRSHFTQDRLMIGVAGGYPSDYAARLQKHLSALPAHGASLVALPPPPKVSGRDFTLIDKPTGSVGIHFGFPLALTWADDDYYALMVANSYLGEHRTFNGRLMNQLRAKRGLNYGDYSYIEYYYLPPYTSNPTPNVPRHQQYFSVWIRPVVPDTAHFALRDAIYEVERLVSSGMTEDDFELTRDFLINYSKLWAQTLPDRLGFLMDSRFYGTDDYIQQIENHLRALTVDDVNSAVRKYLQTKDFQGVFVTDHAADVKAYLLSDEPSPMHYNSVVTPDVLAADKTIEKLPVSPDSVRIVPVSEMFER